MTKSEIMTEFQDKVMELNDECIINDFQTLFLCDVFYFQKFKSNYIFIEKIVTDKFKIYGNKDKLLEDINELLALGLIIKEYKRSIFNGNFVTSIKYTINEQRFNTES